MKAKIVSARIFLISIIAIFIAISSEGWAYNTILDPSFEGSETGKTPEFWEAEGQGQVIVVDDKARPGNSKCLRMTTETLGQEVRAVFKYTRSLLSGYSYFIEMAVNLEKREIGGFGTRIEVVFADTKEPIFSLEASPPADFWQGWREYSGKFTPDITKQRDVELVIYRAGWPGKVWVDDICFEEERPIDPYILLCSPVVQRGQSVTVRGGGFPPGELKVYLDSTNSVPLAVSRAAANGSFEVQVIIPSGIALRDYYLIARVGSWQADTLLKIVFPSPADLNISGIVLNDNFLSAGDVLKVRVTGTAGAQAGFSVEGVVQDISLKQEQGLGLYQGEYKPSLGLKIGGSLVTVKLIKDGLINEKQAGTISINTIVPIVTPYEGPSVVKNGEVVTFAVKVEPLEGGLYAVEADLSGIDTTKINPVILPFCPACPTAGIYRQTIYVSPNSTARDGLKKLPVRAINEAGNIGQTYVEVRLENFLPQPEGPKIISFTFSPDKITAAGQEVMITLVGEPDCSATASIAGVMVDLIEVKETPGVYQGIFRAPEGAKVEDGVVSAALTKEGRTSKTGASKRIFIDTVPEPEPEPEPEEKIVDQVLQIPKGISIIALTVNPGNWRLSDLAEYIGPDALVIIWHDNQTGKFISFVPGRTPVSAPSNKVLEAGEGYIVNMAQAKTVVFKGTLWTNENSAAPQIDPLLITYVELLKVRPLRRPVQTKILQNFPNPFNPETWIPYQLAKEAEVVLRVYNVKGQLIRTLRLGKQSEGSYLTKERAAYWDGRNEFGEKIANGVYFCTLHAGNYTAARKMLAAK